jgi:geranylgeranyl reductase family protein
MDSPVPRNRAQHRSATDADVIVVGAGPGGSSAATFLARQGISTLVLDKSEFPRDKVCGDGLTPQAVYWLDQLGCVDEVLAATNACIKDCDLYIDGEHILTGGFPNGTAYPDFAILLERRRFDAILLNHAIATGARFQPNRIVRSVKAERGKVRVFADADGTPVEYAAKMVIGADGVNSAVSRSIGNALKSGATAVSLRSYYKNVKCDGAQVKVYFDSGFFPGYGWLFVDDGGFANIGLGYLFDPQFPMPASLRETFNNFIDTQLAPMLKDASQCGAVSGGAASFYRPMSIVSDGVLLIGDAANQADPLNGGGIHKAMESAYLAAGAAAHALNVGDFSSKTLAVYEQQWNAQVQPDWEAAELLLSIAKNPDLKEFCLFLLTQIGKLSAADPRFQDFCAGVFSGVISQSVYLSPRALYYALPSMEAWKSLLNDNGGVAGNASRLAVQAFSTLSIAGARSARRPMRTARWAIDIATKMLRLTERQIRRSVPLSPNFSAAQPFAAGELLQLSR